MNNTSKPVRRHDLDWMRVIGILGVFAFHSMRFFNEYGWHVSNTRIYPWLLNITRFFDIWMMPFMFVISGASLFYVLGKGGWLGFLKDKTLRLIVPCVVAMFSHVAVQVYLERISHGQFSGTFFQFIPEYFKGIYGFGGNFAIVPLHLWYLEVLFLFSLVCIPLFALLKTQAGSRWLRKAGDALSFPGGIYVLALVVLLLWKLIEEDGILGLEDFNWNLGIYLSFFLYGYFVLASDKFQTAIIRHRWISLVGAVVFAVWFVLKDEHDDLAVWFLVLAFLGFGMRYLNFETPFLRHASPAVLPFYILHQSVLITFGFFVVRWPIPDVLKWFIIAVVSLAVILSAYEAIRRVNVLRVLFGMKPLRRTSLARQVIPQPATLSSN